MYSPAGSITLDKITIPQIRLGIQGFPGEGKTYGVASFPNPIYLSLDRGLGALSGRADIMEMPFYNDEFVDKWARRNPPGGPPNRRDAIKNWLTKEGPQLEANQTLIADGLSGINTAFDRQQNLEPVYTKAGKEDDYGPWRLKIVYMQEICDIFKSLRCHVILLSHEIDARNKDGTLNGKIKPLITGQFANDIVSNFTDWFRAQSADRPTGDKLTADKLKLWNCNSVNEFNQLFHPNQRTIWFWQTEGDDQVACKTSSLVNFPRYLPNDYKAFVKYMRKPISTANV